MLTALSVVGSFSTSVAAQGNPPDIEYGAISGNAFDLFNDDTGSGVEVVAFGPKSIDKNYGVVVKNYTDAPVYGINGRGDITGKDGSVSGIVSENTIAPYAVPTNGLAIQWGSLIRDQKVGDNAALDVELDSSETPEAGHAPRLPIPFDDISRASDTVTGHVTNRYAVALYAPLASLICFDKDGAVTNAAGAVPTDDDLQIQPIAVGADAAFEFDLTGDTACDYFLVAGMGIDASEGAGTSGTDTVVNEPQVASQANRGRTTSARRNSTGIQGPVADCTPFADYDVAQDYYADHPEEQATIDPNNDGFACEVFFGVDPSAGTSGGTGAGSGITVGGGAGGSRSGGASGGGSGGTAPDAPVVVEPPAAAPPVESGCDPSYPTVCIPPYSQVGDLDCGDIGAGYFTVLPPDPHGFDRDNDGYGCESN